jgi:hypothetical protein
MEVKLSSSLEGRLDVWHVKMHVLGLGVTYAFHCQCQDKCTVEMYRRISLRSIAMYLIYF